MIFFYLALCFTGFLFYLFLTLSTLNYLVPGGCLIYFNLYYVRQV